VGSILYEGTKFQVPAKIFGIVFECPLHFVGPMYKNLGAVTYYGQITKINASSHTTRDRHIHTFIWKERQPEI
jgi:hypothetical protein